jgi:ABC-type dipeptide/oligopeptide/nickel transport system ATPase component
MNVDDEHFMCAVVGREGSGKSHSAISMASAVDPSFTADDVFFNPADLLEAFDSDEYEQGNVIILDEAGVGMGRRSWYDQAQILLNQTLQTVRDDNMGVFFTLPRLEELDSQTIGRLHAFIEMTDVYKDEGWALSKWKNINLTRDGRGREFKKYPRMRVDGIEERISRFAIPKPDEKLVERYEERKEQFKDELYQRAMEAYDDSDEASDAMTPTEVADEIVDEGVSNYMSEHGGNGRRYVDHELIRADYELSHRDAKAAKKILERSISDGSQNTQGP